MFDDWLDNLMNYEIMHMLIMEQLTRWVKSLSSSGSSSGSGFSPRYQTLCVTVRDVEPPPLFSQPLPESVHRNATKSISGTCQDSDELSDMIAAAVCSERDAPSGSPDVSAPLAMGLGYVGVLEQHRAALRQHRAQHRHAGAATPLFIGDLSKTAAHYVSLFYDCRPELLDVKVGQLLERDLALLFRVGTHHAEPLEIWRLIQSDADLRGVATLLLTSRCLCTLCAAMVGSLASSGAMRISARHDEEMLQPVLQLLAKHTSVAGLGVKRPPKEKQGSRRTLARLLAALAAAEADLEDLRRNVSEELDQELASVSNALRQHNAAVQQVEAGEGAGGANQPPLPKGRSRSSEVIGDKEKVHTGSTTVGDEWRKAEDNRKKQLVRACDSVGIWYCAHASVCHPLLLLCCCRSAPRTWPRMGRGRCRSGGRRNASSGRRRRGRRRRGRGRGTGAGPARPRPRRGRRW
jgi:hypothetical protein